MEEVRSVAKQDRNTAQNFNFRGIDAVVNAVAPALRKYGVVVVPLVEDYTYSTVEVGRNRTQMGHVIVTVRYRFIGAEGDSIDTLVIGEAMDSGDKAVPKAMSVAFRTALLQALTLPTDEADPDAHSYERSEPKKPATAEQVAEFGIRLGVATDIDALNVIATEAATYALSDEDRKNLLDIYNNTKTQLSEETK